MSEDLTQKAINAALSLNWQLATETNKEILQKNPKDVEALNRLGKAYLELGKCTLAKSTFNDVLKIDPYNNIASRNLAVTLSRKKNGRIATTTIDPNLFLEEPGKTKTVNLIDLADKKVILSLSFGEEIKLELRKRSISISTLCGIYLGKLPDDLSLRLTAFIKSGNQYKVHIKSTGTNEIKIFIREISRAKKFLQQPTFPPQDNNSYQAFVSPDLIHESRPDTAAGLEVETGDEDEGEQYQGQGEEIEGSEEETKE